MNTHNLVSILLYVLVCYKCNYVLSSKSPLRLVVNKNSSKTLTELA